MQPITTGRTNGAPVERALDEGTTGNGDGGRRDRLRVIEGTAPQPDGPPLVERRQRPHGLPRVSVVIPTLNEERNLVHVLPGIPAWVDEVLIVDGRSTDATIDEARRLLPDVRILREPEPGKGRALFTGMRAATGDIIVALDADGSMAAEDIPRYVYALMAGADYVKGSRFVHGAHTDDITPFRRLGNRGLTEIVRRMYGGRYSDLCYGYFALWRDVIPYLEGRAPGFEVETHINVRALAAGLQVVEVPSFEAERIHGSSNLNTVRDGTRVLRKIFSERRAFRSSTLPIPVPGRSPVAPPARRGEPRAAGPAVPPRPSLTVAVCTHDLDRWHDLVRCVDSVRQQSVTPDEVIVVVDHNDELSQRATAELDGVRVLDSVHRRGLSGARNTAVEAATGEVVAFVDDDAWAEPDWAERLLDAYADPTVAGVGGSVDPHWETGRPSWFPEEFDWVVGCTYRGMPTVRSEVRNPVGANISFRRSALDRAGAFAESLGRVGHDGAGCEETELCIRLRQRDPSARILFEPAARVRHRVPAARATFDYFATRCRAEGRSKAFVSQLVGADDGLSSERTYVRRTLPAGVIRSLAPTPEPDQARTRAGALAAGLWLVATSYVEARRRLATEARNDAAAATVAEDVTPSPAEGELRSPAGTESVERGVADLELTRPLPDLIDIPALGARLLVRVKGRPVGQVDLDGGRAWCTAAELAERIAVAVGGSVADQLRSGVLAPGTSTEPPDGPAPAGSGDAGPVPMTVVIATRDRPELLARSLDSVLAASPPPAEVIVVDSAPADDRSRDLVAERYADRVTYVREALPGLGRAHNAALPLVTTPLVAFTDDDVVVDARWVGALGEAFGASTDVACVTGLIAPAELRTREQWWIERSAGFGKGFERRIHSLADGDGESSLFPFDAGTLGSGANMAFRTDALRAAGGFDAALGAGTDALGGDDLAAFHQVIVAGHELVYEPDAVVFHRHHDRADALERQAYAYGAGLTAYLASAVAHRPAAGAELVRRAASGLRWALHPDSTGNARRPADYPGRLVRRQRVGMVAGPFRYLRQRRIDARKEA